MSADKVTTPDDLIAAPKRQLLDGYLGHVGRLVDARSGIGDPRPVGRLRGHALGALATAEALSRQMAEARWINCVDALNYGARLADVAATAGSDVDEVQAGLRSWGAGQFREGLLTRAQYDEVLALVDGGEVTR